MAVVDPRARRSLTYRELDRAAGAICQKLTEAGVSRGDRVGICAPKSVAVVASIHAVLAAGAAYVPADVSAPAARAAVIFEDCSVKVIIAPEQVREALQAALPKRTLEILCDLGDGLLLFTGTFESREMQDSGDQEPITASDIAYILYTSGSTGRPKGVVHTHASATSFVDWCSDTFSPSSDDRFSSHAPFHFDLSILDLFLSAKHASAVVVIPEDIGKQPQGLAALIAEQRITIWYSTPSTLRLLTRFGRLERHDLSSLRLVLFAGEVFPPAPLRDLVALLPSVRFYNLYGPTETNVCTYFQIPPSLDPTRVVPYPIGKTCENDLTRVIGDDGRDVATGQDGELCVSGGSVMSGYWGGQRSGNTCFIEDSGTTWYRTGDVVQASEDGYVFLGRRDRMVKRRGYRVELGEIEAALSSHPSIAEAAVTALPDDENGVRLEAWIACGEVDQLSIIALKQFCASTLPAYMVPDQFRFVDAIPQTSTGKTDYQQLSGGLS